MNCASELFPQLLIRFLSYVLSVLVSVLRIDMEMTSSYYVVLYFARTQAYNVRISIK